MDEAAKEQLTAEFRAYLDATDGANGYDLGQDDEDVVAPDLFTLLAELAALKNEVKLESRQVKTALDQFRDLFDTLRDGHARLAEEQQQRARHEQATTQQAQKVLLLELLDLRDRVQAGHDQCLGFRPGWLGRRRATEFVASMAEGMAMNLRRLDETLARRGVKPLPVLEQSFDPHTMHAAELGDDPSRAEGIVLAELRRGFLLQGQLLRTAEVVVNRPGRTQPPPQPRGHTQEPSPPQTAT
jgi:molecular chaperone GrpE